jgi:hypothetical protein
MAPDVPRVSSFRQPPTPIGAAVAALKARRTDTRQPNRHVPPWRNRPMLVWLVVEHDSLALKTLAR